MAATPTTTETTWFRFRKLDGEYSRKGEDNVSPIILGNLECHPNGYEVINNIRGDKWVSISSATDPSKCSGGSQPRITIGDYYEDTATTTDYVVYSVQQSPTEPSTESACTDTTNACPCKGKETNTALAAGATFACMFAVLLSIWLLGRGDSVAKRKTERFKEVILCLVSFLAGFGARYDLGGQDTPCDAWYGLLLGSGMVIIVSGFLIGVEKATEKLGPAFGYLNRDDAAAFNRFSSGTSMIRNLLNKHKNKSYL